MRDKVLMGRWDDDIPLSSQMAKRNTYYCLCLRMMSAWDLLLVRVSFLLCLNIRYRWRIYGFCKVKRKKKWYAKNESHEFFLSRILMVTRFIYVCLEKFNSFLINSSLSSIFFRKVARWELTHGFFSVSDVQLDFDLSGIYSNVIFEKNKSWLFVDDDIVIVYSFKKLKIISNNVTNWYFYDLILSFPSCKINYIIFMPFYHLRAMLLWLVSGKDKQSLHMLLPHFFLFLLPLSSSVVLAELWCIMYVNDITFHLTLYCILMK